MWQPLTTKEELQQGTRLRKIVHEGDFTHESIFVVSEVKNLIFSVTIKEQNKEELPEVQQLVFYYTFNNLQYQGFQYWDE